MIQELYNKWKISIFLNPVFVIVNIYKYNYFPTDNKGMNNLLKHSRYVKYLRLYILVQLFGKSGDFLKLNSRLKLLVEIYACLKNSKALNWSQLWINR